MLGRTADILEAVIEGFIDTGEPVSSGWLYKRHDFGIKPAMIRWELDGLSRRGFLEQPHHSAGRVPTDRGYEFFAERALRRQNESLAGINWALELFRKNAWGNLVEELSEELGLVAVAKEEKEIYKTGIEELLENLDWDDPAEIKTAIRDFVSLENNLLRVKNFFEETPQVFIGRKSPVTRSLSLAVVGSAYRCPEGQVTLLAIGPKRMDYKKTIKIFKNFHGRKRK